MLKVLALFSILLSISLAQDPSILARLSRFSQLSSSPLYELYWSVNGDRITFAVRVETNGWVGFGISPNGLMLDSDVVMGFVEGNTGTVSFTVSCCYNGTVDFTFILVYMSFFTPLSIISIGLCIYIFHTSC